MTNRFAPLCRGKETIEGPTKNTSDTKVDACKIRKCSETQNQKSHDKVSNTVVAGCLPPPTIHTNTHTNLFNTTNDKYDLDLKFKPKYKDIMDKIKSCPISKLWDSQTKDKYGFIPLGNQTIPDTDLREVSNSGNYNFMKSQIQVDSQLKPDIWESYLKDYWDVQLPYLIRYGFPIDFDCISPLKCDEINHQSAINFPDDVKEYLKEETHFKAILGPFKQPPITNLHISPLMTREKPNSTHRRVIVDLSFPQGLSVNAEIKNDAYLDTPFLLTLPSIDNITSKVRSLGKGSLLFKSLQTCEGRPYRLF